MNATDEIIALRWYPALGIMSDSDRTIGFVMLINREVGYFKVYIGLGYAQDEEADARMIAEWGAPLLDEQMARAICRGHAEGLEYRM